MSECLIAAHAFSLASVEMTKGLPQLRMAFAFPVRINVYPESFNSV